MSQIVLILGGSGRFGRNAAQAFEAAGWVVRHFDRKRDDLDHAAAGADVIVNAWNPQYPDWEKEVPELTQSVIRAARLADATVIIPGNVYVFGEHTPAPWSEMTAHGATNPLGRVRIEMEAEYARSGVRTLILRGGDFIDTCASGNWFDMVMTKSLAKGVFTYPGAPEIPHAWAYLPDMTRALVELVEMRERLPRFADIPFPGYTLSGEDLRAALERVTGIPVRLKRMSYLPLYLARPFWRLAAPLLEMRYLWTTPHNLDGARFNDLLPDFRATTLESALASAVDTRLVERNIHPDEAVTAGR